MAVVNSVKSGNWSDGATWSGGAVPAAGDNITISSGHTVIVDAAGYICEKSLTVLGKLTMQSDLQTGNGAGKDCAVTMGAGAEIAIASGITWKTGNGTYTLKGDQGNWCRLSGAGSTNAPITYAKLVWDCQYFSCTMTGSAFFPGSDSIGITAKSQFKFISCVFSGYASLTIGTTGSAAIVSTYDYEFTGSDFRGPGKISINGAAGGTTFGKRSLKNATIFASNMQADLRINILGAWDADGVVFINALQGASRTCLSYSNSFFGVDAVSTPIVVHSPQIDSICRDSVIHNANVSPSNSNPHLIMIPYLENCVIQMQGSEPNAHVFPSNGEITELRTKNCLMVGNGDLANIVHTSVVDYDIANNTVAIRGSGSVNSVLLNENAKPTAKTYGFRLRNNLLVGLNTGPVENMVRANDAAYPLTVDGDHNCIHNCTNFYEPGCITNSNAGVHDFRADPQFVDPTRDFESWTRQVLGDSASYLDGYKMLLRKNGFDEATATQKSENIPAQSVVDLIAWMRDGYTPRNMALATAGEGGTYIGAIIPGGTAPVTEYAISVRAVPASIAPGESSTLTATLVDAGTPVQGKAITWSIVSGGNYGVLTPSGSATDTDGKSTATFAGSAFGRAAIKATLGSDGTVSGEASVSVREVGPVPESGGGPLTWKLLRWG